MLRHIHPMPMPAAPDFATTPLDTLGAWIDGDSLPPVDSWHPEREGSIDIRIAADGRWYHEGGEITRPAMVRTFARILRREADGGHVLVTPAEKLRITVEDAPLIAVEARIDGAGDTQTIAFRLNSAEGVMAGADHPLRLRAGPAGILPYLHVRGPADRAIEARLARPVYYQLAEIADADGMVTSGGMRFALGAPE
jgi:uncharacterized protein